MQSEVTPSSSDNRDSRKRSPDSGQKPKKGSAKEDHHVWLTTPQEKTSPSKSLDSAEQRRIHDLAEEQRKMGFLVASMDRKKGRFAQAVKEISYTAAVDTDVRKQLDSKIKEEKELLEEYEKYQVYREKKVVWVKYEILEDFMLNWMKSLNSNRSPEKLSAEALAKLEEQQQRDKKGPENIGQLMHTWQNPSKGDYNDNIVRELGAEGIQPQSDLELEDPKQQAQRPESPLPSSNTPEQIAHQDASLAGLPEISTHEQDFPNHLNSLLEDPLVTVERQREEGQKALEQAISKQRERMAKLMHQEEGTTSHPSLSNRAHDSSGTNQNDEDPVKKVRSELNSLDRWRLRKILGEE